MNMQKGGTKRIDINTQKVFGEKKIYSRHWDDSIVQRSYITKVLDRFEFSSNEQFCTNGI